MTLSTEPWEEFKYNYKSYQWDLGRIETHASGVQNIFCLKSYVKGHKIYQLGSLVDSALVGHRGYAKLAGRLHVLKSRISNITCSESFKHAT